MLKHLDRHPNVVRLLHHFVAVPPPPMFKAMPVDTQGIAVKRNRRNGRLTPLKTQFVGMECHEQSLEFYLEACGSALTAEDVQRLCAGIAAALLFLEQQHIVHRDLKLSNILVNARDGTAVVCDFGWRSA